MTCHLQGMMSMKIQRFGNEWGRNHVSPHVRTSRYQLELSSDQAVAIPLARSQVCRDGRPQARKDVGLQQTAEAFLSN